MKNSFPTFCNWYNRFSFLSKFILSSNSFDLSRKKMGWQCDTNFGIVQKAIPNLCSVSMKGTFLPPPCASAISDNRKPISSLNQFQN